MSKSKRFQAFKNALAERGYYPFKISDYVWRMNGQTLTFEELLAYGRYLIKNRKPMLFNRVY